MKSALTLLLALTTLAAAAQSLLNEGAILTVGSGAVLYVPGSVQNNAGGTLTNTGTVQLAGDLTNAGTLASSGPPPRAECQAQRRRCRWPWRCPPAWPPACTWCAPAATPCA